MAEITSQSISLCARFSFDGEPVRVERVNDAWWVSGGPLRAAATIDALEAFVVEARSSQRVIEERACELGAQAGR